MTAQKLAPAKTLMAVFCRERIVASLKAQPRQRYADIGQQEGCSAATVARVAKAEGLTRGRGTHRSPRGPDSLAPEAVRDLLRAGWLQADIARVLHLSRQRVSILATLPPPQAARFVAEAS